MHIAEPVMVPMRMPFMSGNGSPSLKVEVRWETGPNRDNKGWRKLRVLENQKEGGIVALVSWKGSVCWRFDPQHRGIGKWHGTFKRLGLESPSAYLGGPALRRD